LKCSIFLSKQLRAGGITEKKRANSKVNLLHCVKKFRLVSSQNEEGKIKGGIHDAQFLIQD
jgi:hypothetical protein